MARITNIRNSKKKATYYGKFVNLYKGGYSVTQITKMLPVTNVTLYNWLHEAIAKGEITKGEASPIPFVAPSENAITQDKPIQNAPLEAYLAKEPPSGIRLTGLPQLAEQVVALMSKPAKEVPVEDYRTLTKEELISIITSLKKEKSQDEIKIKAYQTVIEIAGRNLGEELLKKVGAKQSAP